MAVFRRKFITIIAQIRKKKDFNYVSFYLRNLERKGRFKQIAYIEKK